MAAKQNSTRLGQILLDKGIITVEQLDIAVKEQIKRRQQLDPLDARFGVNTSLGEILIELGFIDRLQLKRGLSWQMVLRKMTIAMSLFAPLMTSSYSAAAATVLSPGFTAPPSSSSSSVAPTFTKTSSSTSSTPPALASAVNNAIVSSSSLSSKSSAVSSSTSSAPSVVQSSSVKSVANSYPASAVVSSSSKSSNISAKTSVVVDTTAPTAPNKISAVTVAYDHVQISWSPSTDNVGVVRYKIFRDQVQIDSVDASQLSYTDYTVAPSKSYLYGVSAGDAAGNWSAVKSSFIQTPAKPATLSVASSSVPVQASSSSKANSSVASSVSSTPSSNVASSSSSAPAVVSSSSSSKAAVSSASSSTASSVATSSGPKSATVAGTVSFEWNPPTHRANGDILNLAEVGGYELRYRKTTDTQYTSVSIDPTLKNYTFPWLNGTYVFQIAAYDVNGLYSNFIDLTPI